MDFGILLDTLFDWATTTGVKLLVSIVILFVSFKIIKIVARKIEKSGTKHSADKTIMRTASYIFGIGAKAVVILCLLGYVGLDTGGITALIASLGVGVGLAVNGALSNLAGGVILILTRPFRIDDFIEAQGYSGTVEDIHITNTKLRTPDNKTIYIPNGALSSGTIVNYSLHKTRRVEVMFSVSYFESLNRVREIITDVCLSHPLVLKDPQPFVRVSEHTDHAVSITTRVWVRSENYWQVRFDLLETIKERFDSAGIRIPYNQLDVHLKND